MSFTRFDTPQGRNRTAETVAAERNNPIGEDVFCCGFFACLFYVTLIIQMFSQRFGLGADAKAPTQATGGIFAQNLGKDPESQKFDDVFFRI